MRTSFALLAFAACLAVAAASCPSQCSGHGTCGANDKCTCYAQTGTNWGAREGWVGADCSLRTCPLGTAWSQLSTQSNRVFPYVFEPKSPANDTDSFDTQQPEPQLTVYTGETYANSYDTTVVIRVVNASFTYEWKYITDEDYSDELDMETDRTRAYELGSSGIRVYWLNPRTTRANDKYTFRAIHNQGVDWVSRDDNTAHQMQECSSRGACNRVTGECECMVGYEGEACQRTSCPNNCNDHGVCQAEYRFAADASATYNTAWDQEMAMGCLCDEGWRGNDCSQRECPSGADPLGGDGGNEGRDCSGRGVCHYDTGNCECFKGYFGTRCEFQTNFM